jgi:hypothetical protein
LLRDFVLLLEVQYKRGLQLIFSECIIANALTDADYSSNVGIATGNS